ncbi:hypothetical protein [Leptospira stimsonii]|uniref:Uncharacterized protein n=1 Tax=Leptospira stimsonii TaxID=2202203 RepID=A0A396YT91_9LEPT|nr:hypothetical protein [Leptospira stimsonii]RHX85795.1 hypothetical protein DLM75_19940 [Leptospira stimsonii]
MDIEFWDWLKEISRVKKIGITLAGFGGLITYLKFIPDSWVAVVNRFIGQWDFKSQNLETLLITIISVISVIGIFSMTLMIAYCPLSLKEEKKESAEITKSFRFYWFLLWVFWLFQYISLSYIFLHFQNYESASEEYKSFYNLLNNLTTAIFIICFLLIYTGKKFKENITPIVICLVFFLLFLAELFLGSLMKGIEVLSYKFDSGDFFRISEYLCAFAMVIFPSRLESRSLGTPLLIIILLYVYGLMQFLGFHWLILVALLLFKFVYFILFTWLFVSGRLQYYFYKLQSLDEEIGNERPKFLER